MIAEMADADSLMVFITQTIVFLELDPAQDYALFQTTTSPGGMNCMGLVEI